MGSNEDIYRELQEYLDTKTLGFPATKSGSDIRLLKQIFTPELALATMTLTHNFESISEIHERAKDQGMSRDELESRLYEAAGSGLIGHKVVGGEKYFKNIPYLIGFAEGQMHNSTPGYREVASEYTSDGAFMGAFLRTKIPQMRTIPINESLTPEHHVSTYDEMMRMVKQMDGPIAVFECVCRKASAESGNPCEKTSRKDTCMAFNDTANGMIDLNKGRSITKKEALDILGKNEDDGMVFQPSNTQELEYVCSCCGCCCGILALQKALPKPVDIWASNYYAQVDPDLCTGCETCLDSCQVNAMLFDDDEGISKVDLDRCIGCGNCIPTCQDDAILLIKKETEVAPPKTSTELYDEIMAGKNPA